jgi:predicted NAD/FAD-binding protein
MSGANERKSMNANKRRVPTTFGPETRFCVEAVSTAACRADQQARFERLKDRLLRERLSAVFEPQFANPLARAATEAAALAWVTPYPMLVFPELFEEKAADALARAERQEEVFQRSRELLAV